MKKEKVKQTATEITVGLFVFAILGALIMFTIVLSYDNIFTQSYSMVVDFENVTGLTKGDKVYVQGVDVGRVKGMVITEKGVRVDLTMKYKVNLHEDYVIQVKPSTILGGKYIDIYEGTRDLPLVDIALPVNGTPPVDFMAEASEAVKAVRASLEEGGILKNLETSMENIETITANLESGKGTLGKLINDDAVYNDLKEITDNLKLVSDRLEKGEGTLGKLLSSDETVYNDLKETLNSFNSAMVKVRDGEGTLGKLVNDESLYDELMKTLAEVRAMIDDIRETSPITSLTSVFFGAF